MSFLTTTRIALAALATCAAATASGQKLHEALRLDLTPEGFDLVATVAKDEFLNEMRGEPLPSQAFELPLLARVLAEDITYTVKLKTLQLNPADGALQLDVVIDDIVVSVGHLRLETWLLPAIGTSCRSSQFHVGNDRALPLGALLGLSVGGEDGEKALALALQDLDFSIERSQYRTTGPEECRGPLGIQDPVTRWALREAFARTRPLVEHGVKYAVKKLLPKIQELLNDFATTPVVVETPDLIVLAPARLALRGQPTALALSPEGLKLTLAAEIKPAPEKAEARTFAKRVKASGVRYATLGVTPRFMTELMGTLLADGTRFLPLDAAMHPLLDTMTDRESLTAFWPDLSVTRSTSDRMQLWGRLAAAPVVTSAAQGEGFRVVVPSVELKYQLSQESAWRDYATLFVSADVNAAPAIVDGKLVLKLDGGTAGATATWAPGYTPVDPTFEKETADAVFQTVVDLLSSTDEPPSFSLPVLGLGDRRLTAAGLRRDGDWALLDLVDAP